MRVPKYRLHKPSGRALIEFDGRRYFLGKYGTADSKIKFQAKLAEWAARHGKTLPGLPPPPATAGPVLVKEVILRFWSEHVTEYYRKRGQPTTTQNDIRTSLKLLRQLFGDTPAIEFDQVGLEVYRNELIDVRDNCIKTVNVRVNHVRDMFRWAASKKIVPAAIWQELLTLRNLKPGRTRAKPGRKILPVPDKVLTQTLPYITPVVAAMVRFQHLTGCRPGEAIALRPCDLVRHPEVDVWFFRPEGHKTEHHGKERRVYIGPRAQEVLRPFLDCCPPETHCFNHQGQPYIVGSYRQAVKRGLLRLAKSLGHTPPKPPMKKDKPGRKRERLEGWVPPKTWFEAVGAPFWHPSQIRHTAATELESDFDPDAARVVLGHGDQRTTRIYAERDFSRAEEVARQIG